MKQTTESIIPYAPSESAQRARSFWESLAGALGQTGAVIGRTALDLGQKVGQAAVDAYQSIDPDMRRHLVQMPLAGLSMLVPHQRIVQAKPDDGHRPVVFVHGLAGHPGNFAMMQLYFHTMGRKRAYSVGFGAGKDLLEMADYLTEVIEQIVACNDLPDDQGIDLIAHSMGGIIARLALNNPSVLRRVSHLVTLGTPHQGTHLARLAATQQLIQLRPNSPVLQRLQQQVPWSPAPDYPKLWALWSHSDVFILPAEGATLEGATNIEMPRFTHYTYLLHPQSWHKVFDLLT